jgi:hypothetical protein
MEDSILLVILLIFFIFTYVFIYYIIYISPNHLNNNSHHHIHKKMGVCDVKTCGAIDPVSDPSYNMQQIVKQSILLEEHITNKNKRCRDCITKHFLHIIGLAEEAQMLATNKCNKYPYINESVEIYNRLFKDWLALKADNTRILNITDELRSHRKKLIVVYFFNDIE